jgi:hypothetical protein
MGLDITHYQATMEEAEPHTMFYIGHNTYGETGAETRESFKEFNVDFDHFRRYHQEIEVPIEVVNVIIVNGKENLTAAKTSDFLNFALEDAPQTEPQFFVRENDEQLQKELHDFEKERGYQNFIKRSFEETPTKDCTTLTYYSLERKEGFYFKSVGYQRKGMQGLFSRFPEEGIYNFALKEDFDHAYSCVDYYWDSDNEEDVKQRREEFKKGFMDNFELGASYISLSY